MTPSPILPNSDALSAQAPLRRRRVSAGVVCVATFGLLCVGALLTPSERGLGTHEQLGLPACGWYERTGVPCITCGMTTAAALAADGHLGAALRVQPAGAAMALLTAVTTLVAGYGAVRGVDLVPLARRVFRWPVFAAMLVLVIGAWVYKIIITMTGA